jgi:RNA polymerase sigma-70 factor (ECF subfamily)
MSADSLDTLLVSLNRGEDAAAERVFRNFEPFLRAIVRRRLTPQLRSKFDSMDVVQSVWADVLRGFREAGRQFTDRDHLRAFLARVAYNHFINQCRHHGPALEREQPLGGDESPELPPSGEPRPSQVAQAAELWERLMDLCPPAHREVLRLRRQGLRMAEIAARTGLHEGSVRRILYDMARRLAATRDAQDAAGSAAGWGADDAP